MASENREIKKMLESEGFRLVRQNKHPIYSDGKITIAIPTGSIKSGRMRKWLRSQIDNRRRELESKKV